MTYATAYTTDVNLTRGAPFTLYVQVYDEEDAEADISLTVPTIRLARSWTDLDPVLEKTGILFLGGNDGKCYFEFTSLDTVGLVARAYDYTVLIDDDPVITGRLGVVAKVEGSAS